jgi:hypothetical protein
MPSNGVPRSKPRSAAHHRIFRKQTGYFGDIANEPPSGILAIRSQVSLFFPDEISGRQ